MLTNCMNTMIIHILQQTVTTSCSIQVRNKISYNQGAGQAEALWISNFHKYFNNIYYIAQN
jgi:hypothetical protein